MVADKPLVIEFGEVGVASRFSIIVPSCVNPSTETTPPQPGKFEKPPCSSLLPAVGLDAFLDRKTDFRLGFLFGL